MRRVAAAAALAAVAACAKPPVPPAAGSFDPAPWLQDLTQLEHHLGVAYANLEWRHAHGVKLDQLDGETRRRIVVDIAGNGGGTDWVRDVARAITPVRLTCPAVAGIHHPHWQDAFGRAGRALASCEVPGLAARDRARLDAERAATAGLLAASRRPCDLFGLFAGGPKTCSLVLEPMPAAPCDPPPLTAAVTSELPGSCKVFEHRPRSGSPSSSRTTAPPP